MSTTGANFFDDATTRLFPERMNQLPAEEELIGCLQPTHHRSIWISDLHLGTSAARAGQLYDFLTYNSCDTLYLVGDIVDGWRMRNHVFWPQQHVKVVQRILACAEKGTRVIYVAGNHDDFLRNYSGISFGNIHLVDEYIHHSPDGSKFWVTHGDGYDSEVFRHQWLAVMGDIAYDAIWRVNSWINRAQNALGTEQSSLSGYLKERVRNALGIISGYEAIIARECARRGLDGVICGHIHSPTVKEINGVLYSNCGDWVESCSALVEDKHGNLEIMHWPKAEPSRVLEPGMEVEMV